MPFVSGICERKAASNREYLETSAKVQLSLIGEAPSGGTDAKRSEPCERNACGGPASAASVVKRLRRLALSVCEHLLLQRSQSDFCSSLRIWYSTKYFWSCKWKNNGKWFIWNNKNNKWRKCNKSCKTSCCKTNGIWPRIYPKNDACWRPQGCCVTASSLYPDDTASAPQPALTLLSHAESRNAWWRHRA